MPESDVRERYDLAHRLYEAGRLTEAEALFRWLCLYSGSAPVNWMGLGVVLQCREQWEDALNAYGMAVQHSEGEEPSPWYHCGICNMQLGRHKEAAEAFREAILKCQPGAAGHGEVLSRARPSMHHWKRRSAMSQINNVDLNMGQIQPQNEPVQQNA